MKEIQKTGSTARRSHTFTEWFAARTRALAMQKVLDRNKSSDCAIAIATELLQLSKLLTPRLGECEEDKNLETNTNEINKNNYIEKEMTDEANELSNPLKALTKKV